MAINPRRVMQHLLNAWPALRHTLEGKKIMVFLDYDGTLTPIVRDPDEAKLLAPQRRFLKDLAADLETVVISGRQLDDLKMRIGIAECIYVANHGFEVEGPQLRHIHPGAAALRKMVDSIAEELREVLSKMPGIHIENKKLSLSIHYRNAKPSVIHEALGAFLKKLTPYLESSRVTYAEGKKVWEVRPAVPWDKGKAVLWLLARKRAQMNEDVAAIYIGDDSTDETAFLGLKKSGLCIRVTDSPAQYTHAEYFLLSHEEVYEFLKKIKKWNSALIN